MSIAAKMNARENRFLITRGVKILNLIDNICKRTAASFTARNRRYAKGTGVITTILHFDKRACASNRTCLVLTLNWLTFERLNLLSSDLCDQLILIDVVDNARNTRQYRNLRGRDLRIAA